MEKGYLKGDEEGNLNLDDNMMLRILVINAQQRIYTTVNSTMVQASVLGNW